MSAEAVFHDVSKALRSERGGWERNLVTYTQYAA